ncbi:MAG: hypothetical protein V6Z82_05655 [Flavobacteriales bacterium]
MYDFFRHLHSGWAYGVLLLTLVGFAYFLVQFFRKTPLADTARKVALLSMTAIHIQFLIGLILYVRSPIVHSAFQHFGAAMKDDQSRLIALEHPLAMIAAVVLATIAYRIVKRKAQRNKPVSTGVVVLFLLIFLTILSRIPWELWFS